MYKPHALRHISIYFSTSYYKAEYLYHTLEVQTYLLIYLLTYLLIYLHTCLLITYLLIYLLITYLLIYLLITYLFTYLLLTFLLLTYLRITSLLITYILITYLLLTFLLLIYLLTPWSRVLLEKLTGFQLVKKFPAFLWTRRFITELHSPASVTILRQFNPVHAPHPSSWRSSVILSSHLRLSLPSGFFPSDFPHQNPLCTSPTHNTCYMPRPSHSVRFDHPNYVWWTVQIITYLHSCGNWKILLYRPS